MNTRGLILSAVLVIAGFSTPGVAQVDTGASRKQELIRELYVLTRVDRTAESFSNTLLGEMESSLPQQLAIVLSTLPDLTDADRAAIKDQTIETGARATKRVRELIMERINFSEVMHHVFFPLYDRYFSEEELKDLVAFYKSPTGRKSIDVSPQLFQESVRLSSELLNSQITEIVQQVMDEEVARFKKK